MEATAVTHQGPALLLKTEKKKPQNNHYVYSKALFKEMLSIHALFAMLPERCALLFSSLQKPVNLWFSKLSRLFCSWQLVHS